MIVDDEDFGHNFKLQNLAFHPAMKLQISIYRKSGIPKKQDLTSTS